MNKTKNLSNTQISVLKKTDSSNVFPKFSDPQLDIIPLILLKNNLKNFIQRENSRRIGAQKSNEWIWKVILISIIRLTRLFHLIIIAPSPSLKNDKEREINKHSSSTAHFFCFVLKRDGIARVLRFLLTDALEFIATFKR